MGKDCLDPNEVWYRPSETPEIYMDHYKAIELNLKKLLEKNVPEPFKNIPDDFLQVRVDDINRV